MRKLNSNLYEFKWLAEKMNEKNIHVTGAADKLGISPNAIYNWLSGIYLIDSIRRPKENDVANSIARMLDCDVTVVREEIRNYLISAEKLNADNSEPTFRSEVEAFSQRVKNLTYYSNLTPLSRKQRRLIRAAIAVLEAI
ncbi:MAG: hypothetical protein IKW90_16045 [Lachnospiraceae bacterium]|nr:hypothetical protein [Lachnospiraceae bacterium]